MSYFIGLLILFIFCFYGVFKEINRTLWKGKIGTVKENQYRYRYKWGSDKLLVGVTAPTGYDYAFKKETATDRFFKSIRFSIEHQTGNKEFDDLIYIISDNAQLHRQISSNSTIINAVLSIFKLAEEHSSDENQITIDEIRNHSGRLWADIDLGDPEEEGKNLYGALPSEIALLLKTVAEELERLPQKASSKWRETYVVKAAIVTGIGKGLCFFSFIQLLRGQHIPFIVDTWQFKIFSVYVTAGILIALVMISLYYLGRSARTHLAVMNLVIFGMFGVIVTSYYELRDINMNFDTSESIEYETQILRKFRGGGLSTTRQLFLEVNDWNNNGETVNIRVSPDKYSSASRGRYIVIKQRRGFFNYRWVESLGYK